MRVSPVQRIVLVTFILCAIALFIRSEHGPHAETVEAGQAITLMFSVTDHIEHLCRDGDDGHLENDWAVTSVFCSMSIRPLTLRQPMDQPDRSVTFEVFIASDDLQRQGGYQHIGSQVVRQTGTLFVFPRPIFGAFHMCNVAEPLWIFWFRADGSLLDAVLMEPGDSRTAANCNQLYAPRQPGSFQYALELGEELAETIRDSFAGSLGEPTSHGEGWNHVNLVVGSWNEERLQRADERSPALLDSVSLQLEPVVTGLEQPLEVVPVPGDGDTLAVVEKTGRIRIIRDGELLDEPLLDLSDAVSRGSEQGLLSLAFHPLFEQNRTFYVNYTDQKGDTQIVSYRSVEDGLDLDEHRTRTILSIAQPASNHNGGQLAFGPDGHLYIATGDGGRAGDPWNHAQNLQSFLGKLLRIGVDPNLEDVSYFIPSDNPFVDDPEALSEIWAYGLRNPWRFSFDRVTGDLYIADVGQNRWEEINVARAGQGAGANYGWNRTEGLECYQSGCDLTDVTLPQVVYGHDSIGGCSITGGFVYRGKAMDALYGAYLFADYCSGRMWAVWPDLEEVDVAATDHVSGRRADSPPWEMTELIQTNLAISAYGQDSKGELYVTDLRGGGVYRLVLRSTN